MIEPERVEAQNTTLLAGHEADLEAVAACLERRGIDAEVVIGALQAFSAAAPSWALGTGGTRFGRFPTGGEPRTLEEKLEDVAAINAVTGATRSVSLHVPWDLPRDPGAIRERAASLGLAIDAMNSNTFQDNPETTQDGKVSFKHGSFANPDPAVREAAVAHNTAVIDLGVELGSRAITIWLADGINHPGQADLRRQFERVLEGLREVYAHLPPDWELYTEHKPFEPAFYATVNADWGSSLLLAQGLGPQAKCLVDLGHHLPNANIEQIVARLAMVDRLGGFHFNDSKYGDDDLTVGSIDPYQLFLIVRELVAYGGGRMPELAYMIDQSCNVKDPLEDIAQSTVALQHAVGQALLVDGTALAVAQDEGDAAMGEAILQRAFRFDVGPLAAEARRRNGAAIDPVGALRGVGYRRARIAERGAAAVATGL
ncbi:sugar isomerase [Egibacter rhizosphaerae]|uniref:Sugar isomerase n=1 Tax=Egibacter rhizosphaerae TaxID=1670831 RepID=A0A411YG45_9ACTN|nr:TIM barrel protein [Egibacter rhizosphaerae]QBI20200.1 sugar isomerase [Egibacter rhizosphaerae]